MPQMSLSAHISLLTVSYLFENKKNNFTAFFMDKHKDLYNFISGGPVLLRFRPFLLLPTGREPAEARKRNVFSAMRRKGRPTWRRRH